VSGPVIVAGVRPALTVKQQLRRDVLAHLEQLRSSLQGQSDAAYIRYVETLRRDECLGWEAKVKGRKFGEPELKAHTLAAELLGMHRAFAAAVADVRAAIAKATGEAA
jgi:hypothetical protein